MNDTGNQPGILGGSGAPGNDAPVVNSGGGTAQAAETRTGEAGGEGTYAAWTSQLSKELKANPDALKAVGGYKSISELVEAFMAKAGKAAGQETGETAPPDDDALEKALAEARDKGGTPPAWADGEAVRKTSEKLVAEFGTSAPEYYRKALRHNGLGDVLAKAGLKSHPDLGRALVLLGRAMTEEQTLPGTAAPAGKAGAVTLAEGARLY